MKPSEFVDCFAKERAALLSIFLSPDSGSQVALDIAALGLSAGQVQRMHDIIGNVLTDAFYTILVGLDGAASIGGQQQSYDLRAEDGTRLTGSGEIERLAFERFHMQSPS